MGLLDKLGLGSGKHRIVIAAHKAALGKAALKVFKRPDIVVDRARSLQQAEARAGTNPPPVLVILQAVKLDDPSLDTCSRISGRPEGPPVVVLYPQELLGLRDAALAAGALDVLPLDPPADVFESVVLNIAKIMVRKHPRVHVTFPVKVFDGPDYHGAYAENLSMGGIQLRSDREIGMGRPVRLELEWPGQAIQLWAVGQQAIHVKKAVVTGMRFVGLSSVELARLEAFLAARGGTFVDDEYAALSAPQQLEVADVIRLASGVDASSSREMREAALRFTSSERLALTGMGGEAGDIDYLIAIAVSRLRALQFVVELEKFDLKKKEAREFAQRVAATIVADFASAQGTFRAWADARSDAAPPALARDIKTIRTTLRRISDRLAKAVEGLGGDLADQLRKAAAA